MRGVFVERTINAPNQYTDSLPVEPGSAVAVAVGPLGFAGTVVLERSLDGSTYFPVESWTDSGVQGSYDVEVYQFIRIGVPSGLFSLGQVYVRLER